MKLIIAQLLSNRWKILMISVISLFFISVVILLKVWKGIPIENMTRDITAIAHIPSYSVFFSQIGIFFWIAASTLCICSASLSIKQQEIPNFKRFLYLSGLITMLLCFDDAFSLHERIFPAIGIPEKVVFIIYGFIVAFWLVKYYSIILKTDYVLLAMAFLFLGLSVFLDLVKIPGLNSYIFEDGCKLIGIVTWFFYFYGNAVIALKDLKLN